VVTQSDVLVAGMADRSTVAALRGCVRPTHTIVDLANIGAAGDWPCRVVGLCW
jgi:hypothetical protein